MLNISTTTKYLIISLVVAIVLLAVFLLSRNETTPQDLDVSGTRPEATQRSAVSNPQLRSFRITSVEGDTDSVSVIGEIAITFSEAINPQTLNISITPEERVLTSLSADGKSIIIQAETVWHNATDYQLTINDNLISTSGKKLDSDSIINFKTVPYRGL